MKIAVTGASGFIGGYVLAELDKRDVEIIAISRTIKHNSSPKLKNVHWVNLDIANPPKNCSTYEWYWRGICGVPFLLRNIFNLQRAGLDSLLIYRNEDNIDLYKRLCEEKKISTKLKYGMKCFMAFWLSRLDYINESFNTIPRSRVRFFPTSAL